MWQHQFPQAEEATSKISVPEHCHLKVLDKTEFS